MTAHDPALQRPEQAIPAHIIAADRLIRPLVSLGLLSLIAAISIIVARHLKVSWFAHSWPPGFAGVAAGCLLLSACGMAACLSVVLLRRQAVRPSAAMISLRRTGGRGQTVLIILFAAAAAYALLSDWPLGWQAVYTPSNAFTAASAMLLLATPWLLADRYLATIPAERLPEIDDLRALQFLPVIFLAAEAILQIVSAVGFGPLNWVRVSLGIALLLVCAELALRALGTWFLPPPNSLSARAAIASIMVGVLRGRSLSPSSMALVVRSQFGMDFSRSWALGFIRSAAIPVGVLMLVLCWFLTGVSRIDMNQRDAYERFGTVTTILRPGLHLGLPLPLGVVRHVEFGVMHSVLISDGGRGTPPVATDASTAEGAAPVSANRLWDSEQPTDVSYIIPSGEQNRQSFQTVSVSVRVLYRIGLTDAAARAALYRIADPDGLVHALSGRMLAHFFASHTLPSVLGENQGVIAGDLRDGLQQALDDLESGIDIVAVTIEAIHPPSGAASAYRAVQASEIEATTQIATEQGRAQTTRSVAQSNAHGAADAATAAAAEDVSAARVDLTDIAADDHPYHAAARPFLLERYFADLHAALANVPLEIVDHRLNGGDLPTIDLRPPGMVRDTPAPAEKTP